MVRFNALLPAGLMLIAGAVLGSAWNASAPTDLHAQLGADAAPTQADLAAAYAELDREAKRLQQPGQLLWHVKRVAELSRPFVVHLESKKREGRRLVDEAGAGILLQRNQAWYVLTNRHVIHNAARDRILIELDDGRQLHPERVLDDVDTDVAVMAIADKQGLTPARIGNSRSVAVGDFVLAVGSPFGLNHSVSLGVVSALGRRDLKLGGDALRYQDFLQTDAAINPGNSGGPLLNASGEVIALNTAIASASGTNEGLGFAIPINMVLFVAHRLIDHGTVRRGRIGVSLDREFDADAAMGLGLPRLQGTRLTAVEPGAPADMAGAKAGDVLLEFDGVTVQSDVHLVTLVSMTPPGKPVRMILLRDGRKVPVTCTLTERGS